jgi:hypothetical protein
MPTLSADIWREFSNVFREAVGTASSCGQIRSRMRYMKKWNRIDQQQFIASEKLCLREEIIEGIEIWFAV